MRQITASAIASFHAWLIQGMSSSAEENNRFREMFAAAGSKHTKSQVNQSPEFQNISVNPARLRSSREITLIALD